MGYNPSYEIYPKKVKCVEISAQSRLADTAWRFVLVMIPWKHTQVSNGVAIVSKELETKLFLRNSIEMAGSNCCTDLGMRGQKGTNFIPYILLNTNTYNIPSAGMIMYCSGTLWFYFGNYLNRSQKWLKEMLKAF